MTGFAFEDFAGCRAWEMVGNGLRARDCMNPELLRCGMGGLGMGCGLVALESNETAKGEET